MSSISSFLPFIFLGWRFFFTFGWQIICGNASSFEQFFGAIRKTQKLMLQVPFEIIFFEMVTADSSILYINWSLSLTFCHPNITKFFVFWKSVKMNFFHILFWFFFMYFVIARTRGHRTQYHYRNLIPNLSEWPNK